MSRFLMIDVGAGTMDILFFDSDSQVHYKAVAKSPVKTMGEKTEKNKGNLLITGCEMGGGNISGVLKERAKKDEVVMTAKSAMTINHDMEKVRSSGIKIIDEDSLGDETYKDFNRIDITDLEIDRLKGIIKGLGIPFSFDVVGICAQDHGMPPDNVSHLDYRHNIFKKIFDKNPFPYAALYRADDVPSTMNRLKSIGERAREIPADEIYVMDSGMAAIMGASMDTKAYGHEKIIVLDIATSHTVGAALTGKEIAGFFEYHTSDITLQKLEELIIDLGEGKLDHDRILDEGGHGAYVRNCLGFKSVEMIVATGPKRALFLNSRLPIQPGAPLGDNMMTGTVGLLESIGRRKGRESYFVLD